MENSGNDNKTCRSELVIYPVNRLDGFRVWLIAGFSQREQSLLAELPPRCDLRVLQEPTGLRLLLVPVPKALPSNEDRLANSCAQCGRRSKGSA